MLRKWIALFAALVLLCICAVGCGGENTPATEDTARPSAPATEATQATEPQPTEATQATEPQPTEPEALSIATNGGVVVVGIVGKDENGWFLTPEQPLDVTYEYFLDNPSVFSGLTRICLFDSAIDGIEKLQYLGQTVTMEGTFRFYRDSFDLLYLLPYQIRIGKTVSESYAAPDLQIPDTTQSRFDPSIPLPEKMASRIEEGKYVYNPYMLSRETLDLMGNDFAAFYCDFVDAFLNYETECPCPDKEFAQMLSTVIYYEFPLYELCAAPFEFVKHYNGTTVTITYRHTAAEHQQKIDALCAAANELLSATAEGQSEGELAKNIYHALCTRMTYDDSALEILERKNAYYAYMDGTGVCVTFANVYNQLLTQVGIVATTAQCDYTATMGHVWSYITVDGKQYFCDPTFELNFRDGAAYAYFCQTYAQRTEGGFGSGGITVGRYYPYLVDETMVADTSFPF